MEINVKIIINNIYYLAKTKKIKIGDLESFAGVSSGYLSKLSKEKVTTIPGTEVLYKISKKLGVTLDSLISIDYSSADPTELYIYKFIDRLIKKTDLMEIDWKMESTEKIEKNHSDIHPLYHYNFRNELVYKSLFYDDIPGVIAYPLGNIYSFEFKDTKYFLIRINALFENQNHIGKKIGFICMMNPFLTHFAFCCTQENKYQPQLL